MQEQTRDDMPVLQFVRESHPTARKEHICSNCSRTIRIGEQYDKTVFKNDDDPLSTIKICKECAC